MRLRRGKIALTVGAALAGVALVVILKRTSPREPLSEDEFLEEVRQLQDGTAPFTGPGTLPPAGADESLVAVIELRPAQRFQYSLLVALFKRYQREDTIGESRRAARHR